jgi:hypothetical protein
MCLKTKFWEMNGNNMRMEEDFLMGRFVLCTVHVHLNRAIKTGMIWVGQFGYLR